MHKKYQLDSVGVDMDTLDLYLKIPYISPFQMPHNSISLHTQAPSYHQVHVWPKLKSSKKKQHMKKKFAFLMNVFA